MDGYQFTRSTRRNLKENKMTIQNSIGAGVSAFGKTLIDDADQPTAVGTLFNNAALTSTTVATGDLVVVQDISNSKAVRTVTAQSIADLAGASAAPADATYITQTPNATLSNEQSLSLLATGIMKTTTATGVVSIAAQGVDYYAPGGTDVAIVDGGTGASTNTAGINNLVSNASLTTTTLASNDLVLVQDVSDSKNLKSVTAQDIANLGPGGSAAPGDATYITQTPSAGLSAEQALSLLGTGLMKNTTATGVVSIGVANTDYLAPDATLISIAALGTAADKTIYTTGVDTWAETGLTAAGRALIDDATASDQRTTLGLGTIATQNSNAVTITGGSITGITDLAVADGGSGSSSFVPFTPICGGTGGGPTSTNPLQSVANLGISGYVLTSNGSGTLPTFQPSGGAGAALYVRVPLTAAQMIGANTTPVLLLSPPGAGLAYIVTAWAVEIADGTFTGVGAANLGIQRSSSTPASTNAFCTGKITMTIAGLQEGLNFVNIQPSKNRFELSDPYDNQPLYFAIYPNAITSIFTGAPTAAIHLYYTIISTI